MTIAANMFMCVNNTVDTVDLTKTWFEDTSYLGQYSNCWTCLVVQPFWKVVFSICLLICLFFTATTNEVWGVFMFELRLCCFPSNCCVIYMVDMCWYSKLWLIWENDTSITFAFWNNLCIKGDPTNGFPEARLFKVQKPELGNVVTWADRNRTTATRYSVMYIYTGLYICMYGSIILYDDFMTYI